MIFDLLATDSCHRMRWWLAWFGLVWLELEKREDGWRDELHSSYSFFVTTCIIEVILTILGTLWKSVSSDRVNLGWDGGLVGS